MLYSATQRASLQNCDFKEPVFEIYGSLRKKGNMKWYLYLKLVLKQKKPLYIPYHFSQHNFKRSICIISLSLLCTNSNRSLFTSNIIKRNKAAYFLTWNPNILYRLFLSRNWAYCTAKFHLLIPLISISFHAVVFFWYSVYCSGKQPIPQLLEKVQVMKKR